MHYTWFFAFILIAWSLALGYFPTANAGLGAGMYWVLGVVSALLLFGSVLAVSRSTTLPSLVSPRNSLTSVFGRTSMRGLPRT